MNRKTQWESNLDYSLVDWIREHMIYLLQLDFLKSGPSMQTPFHLAGIFPIPLSLKLGDSGHIPWEHNHIQRWIFHFNFFCIKPVIIHSLEMLRLEKKKKKVNHCVCVCVNVYIVRDIMTQKVQINCRSIYL